MPLAIALVSMACSASGSPVVSRPCVSIRIVLRPGNVPNALIRLLTVSYTHLDVYKRQLLVHADKVQASPTITPNCHHQIHVIERLESQNGHRVGH